VGFFAFLSLMITGMLIYEGGNFHDNNLDRYSFIENYLSDLGRVYAYSGELNNISKTLFEVALFVAAFLIISLYTFYIRIFRNLENKNKIGIAGSIVGLASTLSCISVALVSFDVYVTLHRICAFALGILMLVANILILIGLLRIDAYPRIYGILFFITNLIVFTYILAYLVIGFNAPYYQEVVKIVGQKLIIFVNFLNLPIQLIVINKNLGITNGKEQILIDS
jgi:hypothetical protein